MIAAAAASPERTAPSYDEDDHVAHRDGDRRRFSS
jgi:hypothetical protein